MTTKTLTDADLASVARHGGRLITEALTRAVDDFNRPDAYQTALVTDGKHHWLPVEVGGTDYPVWIAALAGALGPEKLADVWQRMIQPAYGTKENGYGWRWQAERFAGVGEFAYVPDQSPVVQAVMLHQAEAMVTWPIYLAALGQPAVLVYRHPDAANEYTVDGNVVTIDIDCGSSFDGEPKDVEEQANATRMAMEVREQVKLLPKTSKVRRVAEAYADDLDYSEMEGVLEHIADEDESFARFLADQAENRAQQYLGTEDEAEAFLLPAQPEGTTLSEALGIDEGPAFFQPVEDPS